MKISDHLSILSSYHPFHRISDTTNCKGELKYCKYFQLSNYNSCIPQSVEDFVVVKADFTVVGLGILGVVEVDAPTGVGPEVDFIAVVGLEVDFNLVVLEVVFDVVLGLEVDPMIAKN